METRFQAKIIAINHLCAMFGSTVEARLFITSVSLLRELTLIIDNILMAL